MSRSQLLDGGWQFCQAPIETNSTKGHHEQDGIAKDWVACSKVPTSVHVELFKQGKIPDPFKDLNEWDVQWIQETDWKFKTIFRVEKNDLQTSYADLVFEGLDTFCEIYLNGNHIGSTDNMFMSHRIAAKSAVKEGDNELLLHFKSPWKEAQKTEEENGGKRRCWNGDSNRLYVRKAQYGWGWDWGPVMMTVGPWKPIRFEAYNMRFDDVRFDASLAGDEYDQASLSAKVSVVSGSDVKDNKVKATLRSKDGEVIKEERVDLGTELLNWEFKQGEVEGWYPRGYGSQTLYELSLDLVDSDGQTITTHTSRVAFRNVRLVQEPLKEQEGTSFLFEVNGVRIFCGGSNWIPADSFLTEIKPERYQAWVNLLVEGNQSMLRVWGGGIYEHEALYDACDEQGILVWQDFMFGCGMYPSYPALNDNIQQEAEAVVKRLRNHPSVVIFAGNNEDYSVAEWLKLVDYEDKSGDYMKSKFPARHIYENILPKAVEQHSTITYHRGSPYGGKNSSDATVGDTHQWNVWHGSQEPWSNWDKLGSRFISEFGMQGYPDRRTIKEWSDDSSELFPQSRVANQHNKADGWERRLALYLTENLRYSFSLPSYLYHTQFMQAECLSSAYRLWRREWRGRGKEYTAGALVWQINDCWPCVSWAIVDYYLRPKPAFYAIKRELATFSVGLKRQEITSKKDESSAAYLEIRTQLWACNSSLQPKQVKVILTSFDLDKGAGETSTHEAELAPNSSTEIWQGDLPGQSIRTSLSQAPRPVVVQAKVVDAETGEVLARHSSWPEPYKFLKFPKVKPDVEVKGDEVVLSCVVPIKGIVLDVEGDEEGDEVKWSDQAIDLFPGDEQVVQAKGLKGRTPVVNFLGSEEQ